MLFFREPILPHAARIRGRRWLSVRVGSTKRPGGRWVASIMPVSTTWWRMRRWPLGSMHHGLPKACCLARMSANVCRPKSTNRSCLVVLGAWLTGPLEVAYHPAGSCGETNLRDLRTCVSSSAPAAANCRSNSEAVVWREMATPG